MFKSYLKIALRLLWENKVYVAINLLGLAFSIACCILCYLNYNYRMSFDKNHANAQNIYRLNSIRVTDGASQRWGTSPVPMGDAIKNDLPGITDIARVYGEHIVVKKGTHVFNEKIYYADVSVFSFFNFPTKEGSYGQFENMHTVVLSAAIAEKYFGNDKATGKQLELVKDGKKELYTVAAVMEKIPLNSSFQFDIITSFKNAFRATDVNDWRSRIMVTTFAEIKNKASLPRLAKGLKKYAGLYNSTHQDRTIDGFYFQPFSEVAMSSDIDFEEYVHGSELNSNPRGVMVIVPAVMSLLILMITCFNFTNISIALAGKRLKEIGIRKILGSRKKQLIKQFLTENILLCLIASCIASLLVIVLLPLFNARTGLELKFDSDSNPGLWIFLLLLPVTTAILAGLYPSLYIGSFKPVGILNGTVIFGPKSRFTGILLFVQFTISSLSLIIGILLSKNAAFQSKVDFGYAINDIIVTEINNVQDYTALSDILSKDSRVKNVGGTVQQVGAGTRSVKVFNEETGVTAQLADIGGKAYLNTMDIKLLQGRHFYEGTGLDKDQSVIVNETLIGQLNIKDPVGKQIKVDSMYFTIVGVVADYKEFGLHEKVPPCILRNANTEEFKYVVIRADRSNFDEVKKAVQEAWIKLRPDKPYAGFLQIDLTDKERYMNASFKSVAFFLATVIILLSASGLFALMSLNIIRRRKEVGMRKILGASVPNLMKIVSINFIYIIILAFIAGSSLGYIILDKIIFRYIYAYHPEIGVSPFVITLIVLLFSMFVTAGTKVYNAAVSNPINVLRRG
jgi:putative ABC transport system permease protein